jgi:hypothetical protein
MNATPPSEFATIGLHGNYRKFGAHEWHGPCPMCGGDDRFVIFTDRPFPHWNWQCRKCHPDTGWIDQLNPRLREPMPPEKALALAREREESLRREIERAQAALHELQSTQRWLQYHMQLTGEARRLWAQRGVPDVFQDIWGLGYDPARVITFGGQKFTTPSLTIPIVEPMTKNVTNIRHRLLNPPNPKDKYRPEMAGLPAPMFVTNPDDPIANRTMIVEGEIKSMVSYITADDPALQVVGVPGKNMPDWMYAKFAEADPIYLCFDPDATKEARTTAARLGKERCRLIELPDKIDDLILRHGLDKAWMRKQLAQAVRL